MPCLVIISSIGLLFVSIKTDFINAGLFAVIFSNEGRNTERKRIWFRVKTNARMIWGADVSERVRANNGCRMSKTYRAKGDFGTVQFPLSFVPRSRGIKC